MEIKRKMLEILQTTHLCEQAGRSTVENSFSVVLVSLASVSMPSYQLIGHCMQHSIEQVQCGPCQLILGEYDLPSVDWTLYAAQYRTGSV